MNDVAKALLTDNEQAHLALESAVRKARQQGVFFWTCKSEYETVVALDEALETLDSGDLFCSMCGQSTHKTADHGRTG